MPNGIKSVRTAIRVRVVWVLQPIKQEVWSIGVGRPTPFHAIIARGLQLMLQVVGLQLAAPKNAGSCMREKTIALHSLHHYTPTDIFFPDAACYISMRLILEPLVKSYLSVIYLIYLPVTKELICSPVLG